MIPNISAVENKIIFEEKNLIINDLIEKRFNKIYQLINVLIFKNILITIYLIGLPFFFMVFSIVYKLSGNSDIISYIIQVLLYTIFWPIVFGIAYLQDIIE
jgi:hypothetical protein